LVLIQAVFADKLPAYMTYGLRASAAIQGIGFGVMISIRFSGLPLLKIRHIRPNGLLRDSSTSGRGKLDNLRWIVAILAMLALLFVVSWQGWGVVAGRA